MRTSGAKAQRIALDGKRYLAFEGGGGSGMAYVGALQALYAARFGKGPPALDFTWKLDGVAGSSVGAITALMVALDYTPAEIGNLIVRDGLFTSLFAEQVKEGHFCAAASPVPGGPKAPLPGYFSSSFGPKGSNPADRAQALKAHCCPDSAPKAADDGDSIRIGNLTIGNIPLIRLLLEELRLDDLGAVLSAAVGPYLGAMLAAAVETAKEIDTKADLKLGDAFSGHLLTALARALPEFLASRVAGNKGPLGIFAGYATLLTEDLEKMAKGASSEVKAVALLAQPAALLVLLLVVLLGRNLQGDREDVLNFEEGRKPARRRDRPIVGRNNTVYFAGAFLHILLRQSGVLNHPDEKALRNFAIDTIGSPNFMLPLIRGLTAEEGEKRQEAWRSLGRYSLKLIRRHLGPNFGTLLKTLIGDGGLWHGDHMRDILAFIVLNKVEVAGRAGFSDRGELTFARRERSLIQTLTEEVPCATADIFQLVRRRSRIERRLERLKKRGALREERGKKPDPFGRVARDKSRLDALEARFAKLQPSPDLLAAIGSGGASRLSPNEQLRAIREWFDFSTLRALTKKDLVVTGTNISSGRPVFFRESLTPDFPVTEAVRMSAGFPFVFKPTAVAYLPPKDGGRRRGSDEERERFYRINYCGYFIDGGFLNNHPMHAFNGNQSGPPGADGAAYNTPQEMLTAPFPPSVLGLHLTNDVPEPCPFGGTFEETRSTRGLGALVAGMSGTFFASASTLRFLDPEIEKNTIAIKFGNLDLLDLKPDYFAVLDVQGANYEHVYETLTGSVAKGAGATALADMYGTFVTRGASSGRAEARKNQRQWRQAYERRADLLKVPGY